MNATLIRAKRTPSVSDDWGSATYVADPVGWPPALAQFDAILDPWGSSESKFHRLRRHSADARAARVEPSVREQFDQLVADWEAATMFSSSALEICTNRSYQRIIGLGLQAVPLIFERILNGSHHWGWALAAITQEDPAEDCDTIDQVSDAWMRWGEAHGFVRNVA